MKKTAILLAAGFLLGTAGLAYAIGTETRPSGPAIEQARDQIEDEDYGEAVDTLRRIVSDSPDNADAWNLLGFSYRNLDRTDEAFEAYTEALNLDPDHKGAHEYLGELYLLLNDLAQAEQQLEILVALCPSGCEEREDLEQDIASFQAQAGS